MLITDACAAVAIADKAPTAQTTAIAKRRDRARPSCFEHPCCRIFDASLVDFLALQRLAPIA